MWKRYLTMLSTAAAVGILALPAGAQNYGPSSARGIQQSDQDNSEDNDQLANGMNLEDQVPNDSSVYAPDNDIMGQEQEASRAFDRDYDNDSDQQDNDQASRGTNDEDLALNSQQPDEGTFDESQSGHDADSDDLNR